MPRKGRGGHRPGEESKGLAMGTATHMPENVRPYADRTLPAELPQGPQGAGAPSPSPPRPPGPLPGELSPLTAPTGRPGEPITTGLPFGPGAGPQPSPDGPDPLEMLWAIYTAHPTPEMARLLGADR